MDLVGNDVDTLHENIEHLVGYLVGNDVDTLHKERINLVGFSFIEYMIQIIMLQYNYIIILICNKKYSYQKYRKQ